MLFGVGTGACNVAAVGLAAHTESVPGRRTMSRSHAAFSGALLAGSLAGGAAVTAGVSPLVVALAVSAGVLPVAVRPFPAAAPPMPSVPAAPPVTAGRRRLTWPVLVLCAVGALAMVIESGVQQWSAVLLTGELGAPTGLAGTAPGVFAGAMALGRLAGHELTRLLPERALLAGSGLVSGAGLAVLATAGSVPVALAGIAVVGGAVSVATPMVYTLVARQVPGPDQARTLGAAVALAGVGLHLGPASVGRLAGSTDLRTALAALVVIAAAFLVLALVVRTPARAGCPAGAAGAGGAAGAPAADPAPPSPAVISGCTGRGGAAFVHAATPRHLIGDTPVPAGAGNRPVVPLPAPAGTGTGSSPATARPSRCCATPR
ncbi:MFS transporter [Dactylosporangium cerinum]